MPRLIKPHQHRQFYLSLFVLAVLAAVFWTTSRYPALDDKAIMSGAITLQDPLSFEAVLPLSPQDPVAKRIAYTTINWVDTNRKGMTFGVLFAATFLTLLGYLQRRSFSSGTGNAVLGVLLGAPLGVCVNCAAPIAKGLYSGGARAETTLAAMIASPTLNVVVLTMLISLFPMYMVIGKIVFSLAVMLLLVPVLCRRLPADVLQLPDASCELPSASTVQASTASALVSLIADLGRNLWFIIKTTVPLMLLAGFLGACLATLAPAELLNGLAFSVLVLVLVAIVGIIAPVPISFDVVVCAALLNSGLAIGYVATLLFTLGIFSIYSFFIVATSIGARIAWQLAAGITLLGILAGLSAHNYHNWQTDRALELLTSPMTEQAPAAGPSSGQDSGSSAIMEPIPPGNNQPDDSAVSVSATPFKPRHSHADAPLFSQLEAWEIGIDKPIEFSFADMWPPFWEGRSISSGDIDNDGAIDLVFASTRNGLYIYRNNGQGQFSPYPPVPSVKIAQLPIFNATLVDLNNDGWLDLFITTYKQGNFWVANHGGTLALDTLQPVPNRDDAWLTMALAFADVEGDGDLDIALGNWTAGWYRRVPGEESRNRLVINNGVDWSKAGHVDLPGMPGETLTMLWSDINRDNRMDLLVGNDFEQPDIFYLGQADGTLREITRQDDIIQHTTTTTMSLKTADLDNDGSIEIYAAQIAGRSANVSNRLDMQPIADYCKSIKRAADKQVCQTNIDIKKWYRAGNSFDPNYASRCEKLDPSYRAECRGMLVKDLAIQRHDPKLCDLVPADQPRARQFCQAHFLPFTPPSLAQRAAEVPQILGSNVLLKADDQGKFRDVAPALGLEVGGWSWDVKIADFNNDEWQDVLIVNGTWVPNEVTPSNMYFENQQGKLFSEAAASAGLRDYLMTAAATQLDLEGDGDLDLITVPVNGPVKVFVNNSKQGNSIAFELRDNMGNKYGIGSKIVIHYAGRTQYRELQLGGGFMSFDAPIAYFGLGDYSQIDSVVITWPDGSDSVLTQAFDANNKYIIVRGQNKITANHAGTDHGQ